MTRSYRRRPFAAFCGGSQKDDKRICNRVMRRNNRLRLLAHGDERPFMTPDEAYNVYNWVQDGTRRYAPFSPVRYDQRGISYYNWWRWVKAK